MNEIINKKVVIAAPVNEVWKSLTDIESMKQWMGAPEMELEITTSWDIGSPITITGFHHVKFENRGVVLEYLTDRLVSYNFLSSISRLPYEPENHTVLRFTLDAENDHTALSLIISNFPTETIYHHLNFYWNTTLVMLKRHIEN
jgi:uncharacterized protein YndB with AHSA1/START domain